MSVWSNLCSAQAKTKCKIALISYEHMISTLRRLDPQVQISLLERLNVYWSTQAHRCARLLGLDFRNRLELVLADLATRFGVHEARGIFIVPEFRHAELAEMLGSSRPMVSRLIGEMVEQGELVRLSSKQYLLRSAFAPESEKRATRAVSVSRMGMSKIRTHLRSTIQRSLLILAAVWVSAFPSVDSLFT